MAFEDKIKIVDIDVAPVVNPGTVLYGVTPAGVDVTHTASQLVSGGILPDSVVQAGTSVLDLDARTYTFAGWIWRFAGVNITPASFTTAAIPEEDEGFSRVYIVVGKSDSTFEVIAGVSSEDLPIDPATPPGTIYLTRFVASAAVIGDVDIPIVGGDYVKKAYTNRLDLLGALDGIYELPSDGRTSFNFVAGGFAVKGFSIPSGHEHLYEGKLFYFKNSSDEAITFEHAEAAAVNYNLPEGENFVFEPANDKVLMFKFSFDGGLVLVNQGGASVVPSLKQVTDVNEVTDKGTFQSFTEVPFGFGSGFNDGAEVVIVDSLGRFYVGGSFSSYNGNACNCICRLLPNGDFDSTFAIGSGFNNSVTCIEIDQNGKIYVGGYFTQYQGATNNRIIRLNEDGSKDTVFNNSTGFNDVVFAMELAPDNDLFVGGSFTQYKSVNNFRAIRLNPNGSKRTTFNTGSGFTSGGSADIRAIKVDEAGNIYFGGAFNTYKGTAANNIVCLEPNGTIFSGFDYGSGVGGGVVMDIVIDSKGSIYFTAASYKGTALNGIAKVDASGDIDTEFVLIEDLKYVIQRMLVDADDNLFVGLSFSTANIRKINLNGGLISEFNFESGFNDSIYGLGFNDKGNLCCVGYFTTYKGETANRVILLDETTADALDYTLELKSKLAFNKDANGIGTYETTNDYDDMPDEEIINKGVLDEKLSEIPSGIPDAPSDASAYVRSGLAWVVGYTKAAIDSLLGGKENTSNKATNLTSPDNTKYPTTQAVSDALDGKANINKTEIIVKSESNGIFGTTTGNTVENVVTVLDIAANEFEAGDRLLFKIFSDKNGGSENVQYRVRAGTTGTTSDSLIATSQSYIGNNARFMFFERQRILFLTGDAIRVPASSVAGATDTSGLFGTSSSVSLTPSSAWKLTITAQLSAGAETTNIVGYTISKIKSI